MKNYSFSTILLLIINGLGVPEDKDDVFYRADTPNLDKYASNFPAISLSSKDSLINQDESDQLISEKNHIVLGSGRLYRSIEDKITQQIDSDQLKENEKLSQINQQLESDQTLHLIGSLDPESKFAKFEHLLGLIEYCREVEISANIHLLFKTDSVTKKLNEKLAKLEDKLSDLDNINIASIADSSYGLADHGWDKVATYYKGLLGKESLNQFEDLTALSSGSSDLEQVGLLINSEVEQSSIQDGDPVLFFNYDHSHILKLAQVFALPVCKKFDREYLSESSVYSLVEYARNLPIETIFSRDILHDTVAEVLAKHDISQAYLAPVVKYSHLNYYFNGAKKAEFEQEERICLGSEQVVSYSDNYKRGLERIDKNITNQLQQEKHDFIAAELPNFEQLQDEDKQKQALEYIDSKIGQIVDNTLVTNGACLICSDYSRNNPDVPLFLVANQYKGLSFPKGDLPQGELSLASSTGSLVDIAPTILDLMNLEQPEQMTGGSLLKS